MNSLFQTPLEVVGAGPSGLATAIVAAKAGRQVLLYERHRDVGCRFNNDFQAIENWTTHEDVMDHLSACGIQPTFEALPVHVQVCYGPNGQPYVFRSSRPFYYLVRRGPTPGSLDQELKEQALSAGVDLRFGSSLRRHTPRSIIAKGPRKAYAIAAGYVFETDLLDGCYGVLSNKLAPGGYGYMLVWRGRATLATCIFKDFIQISDYLKATRRFFEEKTGVIIREPQRIGGAGEVSLLSRSAPFACQIGEAAGIQDALWGFGIRYALMSGCLAGRAAVGESNEVLNKIWWDQIYKPVRASFTNRLILSLWQDSGYQRLLENLSETDDARAYLGKLYRPNWWKLLLAPISYLLLKSRGG